MKSALVIFIVGLMIGAAALATFNGVMHMTSTDEFCGSSCHEMSTPLASLQQMALKNPLHPHVSPAKLHALALGSNVAITNNKNIIIARLVQSFIFPCFDNEVLLKQQKTFYEKKRVMTVQKFGEIPSWLCVKSDTSVQLWKRW